MPDHPVFFPPPPPPPSRGRATAANPDSRYLAWRREREPEFAAGEDAAGECRGEPRRTEVLPEKPKSRKA